MILFWQNIFIVYCTSHHKGYLIRYNYFCDVLQSQALLTLQLWNLIANHLQFHYDLGFISRFIPFYGPSFCKKMCSSSFIVLWVPIHPSYVLHTQYKSCHSTMFQYHSFSVSVSVTQILAEWTFLNKLLTIIYRILQSENLFSIKVNF